MRLPHQTYASAEHALPHCLQSVISPTVGTATALAPTKTQPSTQVRLPPQHPRCKLTANTAGLHPVFHARLESGSKLYQASLLSHGLDGQAFMMACFTNTLAYVSWHAISTSLSVWHSISKRHGCLLPILARAAPCLKQQQVLPLLGSCLLWAPPRCQPAASSLAPPFLVPKRII